ncbi:MAG TPA: pitrilysin family protein [Polyangiaceae bacterium LLY-WYZ-15_(1-7)]|nr:pitrilysin family protein [Polyangiaceae bacterium LLY-WYZ-15_(1-7)]HJL08669.1 pitrilysin family protein [Polyangiaceae bacterium LLY-WYZ-15_(1-7)]HJL22176.1 pitrilysin family protein [Polyangiaceae bacterium LLY-WYZ-15_(1-7)]HJL36979.1 pitrilysin family protein [Polyangiaceae bacterium LLY-WYZ-15_(1-7)]HJL47010.1 pitrilysin family protein [Polyangiaceae bacterium LLY-WYZ-15_(1-7)]
MRPADLAQRLSRATRRRHAKLRFLGEAPYGPRLTVRSWRLGNGLRVHTLVDSTTPVVSYQSWFGVGSRHETAGQTGLAHFFEHLMFTGTPAHPAGDFDVRLEEVGAENNAATWTDWTCYYENLPAKELPLALELEADRLEHLALEPDLVASEREVVLSERRDRIDDDVDGRAGEALWATALAGHPYGHPTLGWERDIRAYTVADCQRFHGTWYAPNNLTLVVAGAFDEAALLEGIQARYGHLKPARLPDAPPRRAQGQRKERRKRLRLPATAEKLLLGWHAPAFGEPGWVPLTVLGDLLFGGRSARIYRELVLEDERATDVWAFLPPFALPSLFEAGVAMREGEPAAHALARIDAHIARVAEEGPTEDELERVKARIELGLLSALETIGGKADQIGFHALVDGDPAAALARLEAHRAVTAADVREAARRLTPATRTVIEVEPS